APFEAIAFGAGVFVAIGTSRCSTSTDGQAWEDCDLSGQNFKSIAFVNGSFILPDNAGYFQSSDGVAWNHVDAPGPSVGAFGEGVYVGVSSPTTLLSSTDLKEWTPHLTGGPGITQIAFGHAP